MLNDRGKLIGDFTLARLAPDRFLLTGSGIAETYHLRWFEQHLPEIRRHPDERHQHPPRPFRRRPR
jgi:glycine cleavage system aminomethyltransferase T